MSKLYTTALCVVVILSVCASVCAQDFQLAVMNGDLAKVKTLVKGNPSLVNAKDEMGIQPLYYAVMGDQIEIIKFLIANKADVNAEVPGGMPLVFVAACSQKQSSVDLLLANGADVNAKCDDGGTVLHFAAMMDNRELAAYLMSKGADVRVKNSDGMTPLSMAQQLGQTQMVEILSGKRKTSDADDKPDPRLQGLASKAQGKLAGPKGVKPNVPERRPVIRKPGAPGTKAVTYAKTVVRGCPVNVITANLSDLRVKVTAAISKGGIGTDESFSSFIQRCTPVAAINGAYFSKSNLKPIGDIVLNGKLVNFGAMGSGVCLTSDSQADFVSVERHRHYDWSAYRDVVCCGPRLLCAGDVVVDAESEGFRDPHVMGSASRTGVGLTAGNKLILANTTKGVSFTEWAYIMKSLGCTEAVNMDAGASLGMYYRGRTISSPGRKLTNVLLIYEN